MKIIHVGCCVCKEGDSVRRQDFVRLLNDNHVVAAIKNVEGLNKTLTSQCKIVFILFGDIVNIPKIVDKIKNAGKIAFVHVDLVDGLSSRSIAVEYIAKNTCADGIISTRPNIIKHAKEFDLLTIQRFFVLDSLALNNISNQIAYEAVDAVEILPGVMPKIIKKLVEGVRKPIIAGGLITDDEDIINALGAGASAISSSEQEIWSPVG